MFSPWAQFFVILVEKDCKELFLVMAHEIPSKQRHYAGTKAELEANLVEREIGFCTEDHLCYIKGPNGSLYCLGDASSEGAGSSGVFFATYNRTSYGDIMAAKNDGKLVVVVSPEIGGDTYVVLTQYSSFCAGQFTYETARGATVVAYKVSPSGWERSVKPLAGASQVEALENLIPDEASESNKLTDKSYVDNQLNQVAAKYLSKDEDGNPFDTYEAFEAAQEGGDFFYAGSAATPSKNDYVLVSSDSQHDDAVTRYWYTGSSWSFQYVVNNTPFTDAEWDDIRSGVTSAKLASIESAIAGIPTKTSDLQNDSDFVKVVVSADPPAEGTPDDVLTAILDGEPTPVVTSQDVLHIARVGALPEEPDPNTLYIVVEEA